MKKQLFFSTALTITSLFFACAKNSTVAEMTISLTGNVLRNHLSLQGVKVLLLTLDGDTTGSTLTDAGGNFTLSEIEPGQFKLSVLDEQADSSTVSMDTLLTLTGSLHLVINLPKWLCLYEPHDITNSTIAFRWTQFQADSFQEYRVFRIYTTTSGTRAEKLIFTTPFVYDTTYRDNGRDISHLDDSDRYGYRIEAQAADYHSRSKTVSVCLYKWKNEQNFQVFYKLEPCCTYSSLYQIQGIDFDGVYFWILAYQNIGGYDDNNKFILMRYDHQTRTILKRFEYTHAYGEPHGVAWDGEYVWTRFGKEKVNGVETEFVQKIDPETGKIISQFDNNPYGIKDISWWQNYVYLGTYYHTIQKRHSVSWQKENFTNPLGSGSNWGIAAREHEIWLSMGSGEYLAVINDQGEHIGMVDLVDGIEDRYLVGYLCFMDEKLVVAQRNEIKVFDIMQ